MKFKSDIEVQAGLKDSSGALGLSGQILSSTSGNVSWVTPTVNTVARDVQNEVKAGVAINKGQAVYVTGADGTNIIVGLASNASEATSSKTLGLLNATVAINGFADVVQIGRLAGLNTLGATAGDPVWLGTGGNLIYGLINKPYAPANLVFIGVVTRVNVNNGEIFISVQNGFELNELHDVDLKTTVPINGDVLGYNGTLWVNKTIAGWLGFTPVTNARTISTTSPLQGGGDLTANRTLSILQSNTSQSGFLSSTDWNTFNNKFTLPSFTSGSVLFSNGTTIAQDNANFFWDDTNNRLGIGTASTTAKLNVNGDVLLFGVGNAGRLTLTDTAVGGASITINPQFSTGVPGIDSNGVFPIAFKTNSLERMRVHSNGKVSINNTDSTAGQFAVSNDASVTAYNTTFRMLETGVFKNDTVLGWNIAGQYSHFGNYQNFPLAFRTNDQNRIWIAANGNVGIGQDNPQTKLDVVTSGTVQTTILGRGQDGNFRLTTRQDISTNADGSVIGELGLDYITTRNSAIRFHRGVGTTGGFVTFTTNDGSERMRVASNGNVGIGTTSPGFPLSLGTGLGNKIALYDAGSGLGYGFGIQASLFQIFTNTSSDDISFGYGNSTAFTRNVTFKGNGNVSIGTTAQSGKLTVAGGSIGVYATGSDYGIYGFSNSIGTGGFSSDGVGLYGYSDFGFAGVQGGSEFGIGGYFSSSESYALVADGSAAKPGGGSWSVYSDSRIKENIVPYAKGLADILLINPVTYEYNGLANTVKGSKYTGIIAQEIKEIFPDTVGTYKAKLNKEDEDKTELYDFNASDLTFALINAVKELKAEIEELKKLINK